MDARRKRGGLPTIDRIVFRQDADGLVGLVISQSSRWDGSGLTHSDEVLVVFFVTEDLTLGRPFSS